ncbi:hypothetical protein N0V88_001691 [Collariella sp. IMI 366227]|nr:hypothetical protein N0V88_001691 [Collariella sp. IMI 366227]
MKRSREPEEEPSAEVAATIRSGIAASGPNHAGLKPDTNNGGDPSQPAAKIAGLDLSDNDDAKSIHMRCSLPPHKEPLIFSSYSEYETHYRDQHTNRCLECRKNFPSAHLLSLHIEEMHDSFVQVKREKGERTYSCFVEMCDRKCSTPQKRKMHLVDKHMYPKNYFFAITRDGIDGRRSLLLEGGGGRRRSSASSAAPRPKKEASQWEQRQRATSEKPVLTTTDGADGEASQKGPGKKPDVEMEDLSSAMSALQFVPLSIRFGRGKKAGFAKK